MDEVTSFLYKYVLNNNPYIDEEDISEVEALNNHDLMITFIDGTKEIFDTFNNTNRRVINSNRKPTEKQLRTNFKRGLQIQMNRKWVNQEELAKRLHTTQPMISRYLTGQSIPNAITLKRIADALDCSVDDLYY